MSDQKDLFSWYKTMGVTEMYTNVPTNFLEEKNQVHHEAVANNNLTLEQITRTIADKCNTLADLREAVINFKELDIAKNALNPVFSDGSEQAEVMIIGEAPGANEDEQGIPFCGQSGKLLDKMLACIDLERKHNLYITNTVFWRPPGNRRPTDEENKICLPFVEKHIFLRNPKLIILVGANAAQTLLGTQEAISSLRKKKFTYQNIYMKNSVPMIVTFHPSYLLRQPSQKKFMWYDLIKAKQFL